jgi:TonB family protein
MRTLIPIVFILSMMAVFPGAAKAADAAKARDSAKAGDSEGCVDLKLFPRLEGCVIVECSAKQHDPFDAVSGSGAPADANINALAYTCPAGDLEKMKRDFEAELRKAGFQNPTEEKSDGAGPSLTARKNSQWIHWTSNTEDGATSYSIASASGGNEKFKAEACGQPPALSPLKQCEVVECTSKSEDSVAMRTAQKGETSLTGNVQTVTLACPAVSPAQAFSTVEGELKAAGFDILFSDREHPESSWMTGRAGKRWVEMVSAPDGAESVSYALTVVPSAEVLNAAQPEPSPVVVATATPAAVPDLPPAPVPKPVQIQTPASVPVAAPALPASAVASLDTKRPALGFTPPVPIFQAPIEDHSRFFSVTSDVTIHMLVDVGADGSVTGAVISGRVSSNVLKLEDAAIDAIWHWRFEPARENGRAVPSFKNVVEMHYQARAKTDPVATATPVPAPAPTPPIVPAPVAQVTETREKSAGFVPPTPILEVPIEATHDRIYSVSGEITISLLVDVGEDGSVTKAELSGHISKDVLKLESAAIEAVSHWRFEPARQDGRIVPASKVAVQLHFHGRPWRY